MEASMSELILASGSPRRKELLRQIGLRFRVLKSDADETVEMSDPSDIVKELSRRKAEDVAGKITEGIVIGADTIVWLDGVLLGKPKGRADAEKMLRNLQGKAHQVFTGVTILRKGKMTGDENNGISRDTFSCVTTVHVHNMSEEEINAYLDTGDAFDKAGSYGIQGPFAAYIDGIEGDYTNVVGLPVSEVYRHLKNFRG